MRMTHVLPGSHRVHTFTLEPRHLIEGSPLMVRVKARLNDEALVEEVEVGSVSMRKARQRYRRSRDLRHEWSESP